jgi:hypothetical protein
MTLAELEKTLPSGFHDSALKSLSIDYERRTIRLELSLCVGDPHGPREQRDDVRDALIDISGVVFFGIDPPSPSAGFDFNLPGEISIVSSRETRSIPGPTRTVDAKLLDRIPADAFAHSLFVINWNSYMHIAARGCTIKWLGVAEHYEGPRQHFYPGETIDQK